MNRNVYTCRYRQKTTSSTEYTLSTKYTTGSGYSLPKSNSNYAYILLKTAKTSSGKNYYLYKRYEKIYKTKYTTINKSARCPSGMEMDIYNERCIKVKTDKYTKTKTCSDDKLIYQNGKCWLEVNKTVTYYRYRTREYIDVKSIYKKSNSNNDKALLSVGYKLVTQ